MSHFLECLCDRNYSSIGGTEKQQQEAWLRMIGQYYELRGDTVNGVAEWKLARDIQRIENHLFLLQLCLDFLNIRFSESVAASLQRLGYVFNPVVREPDQYRNMLQGIANKSKTKYIQLQGLQKERDKRAAEKASGEAVNRRKDFEETLLYIEEMQRTTYDLDKITVYKYVMLEKKLVAKYEALNKK